MCPIETHRNDTRLKKPLAGKFYSLKRSCFPFLPFAINSAMPIFYECDRCTACCRWPGQVKLTSAEISEMAAHQGMSEHDFIQAYTRLRADRQGLALKDKQNGECIFLEGGGCAVNPVKPQQCRDFPNLWNFPGFEKICHAKAKIVDSAEYDRLIQQATGRTSVMPLGNAASLEKQF